MDAPEVLRRYQVGVTGPAELSQRLAHHRLRLAPGIDLGVVEEVDPGVVCGVMHSSCRPSPADSRT